MSDNDDGGSEDRECFASEVQKTVGKVVRAVLGSSERESKSDTKRIADALERLADKKR